MNLSLTRLSDVLASSVIVKHRVSLSNCRDFKLILFTNQRCCVASQCHILKTNFRTAQMENGLLLSKSAVCARAVVLPLPWLMWTAVHTDPYRWCYWWTLSGGSLPPPPGPAEALTAASSLWLEAASARLPPFYCCFNSLGGFLACGWGGGRGQLMYWLMFTSSIAYFHVLLWDQVSLRLR